MLHQIGTLRGAYDDARAWGDRALALGGTGSALRRADLMLHLSELHRVTGRAERSAELVHEAADLLRLHELSPEDVDALAPVTCHAFFCLGALAYWEGRPDDARPLLSHAWAHGGDSIPHLWSLVNHALILTDDGDHEAALAFEEAAIEMAERLGDGLAMTGVRNNRACTLRHLGRHDEAYAEFAGLLPEILADDIPDAVLTSCEDFACVLFDMGRDRDGALLVGAAKAEREGTGVPRMAFQEAALAPSVEAGRAAARRRVGAAARARCRAGRPGSSGNGAAPRRAAELLQLEDHHDVRGQVLLPGLDRDRGGIRARIGRGAGRRTPGR